MDSHELAQLEFEMHRLRSEVLGLVAVLEDRVDLVLSLSLARDVDAAWLLYTDLLPSLTWSVRLSQLKRLMEVAQAPSRRRHKGPMTFAQARPLLVPLIQELVDMRNTLAHAVLLPVVDDGAIRLLRRRKGSVTEVKVDRSRLMHLMAERTGLLWTLDEMARSVGTPDVWGAVSGFDDESPG